MFVKPGRRQDVPALPLLVRGPNKRLLSPQGEHVPEITFWHRRVRDGDVVLAEPPAPPSPAALPPVSAAVVPPAVDHAAARAAADAFEWHLPPSAGQPEHLGGEPLPPTAAEHEQDPAAPLLTRDEPSGQSPDCMHPTEIKP